MLLKLLKYNKNTLNIKLYSTELLNCIPKHEPVQEIDIKNLENFIISSSKILVLTGAGISTESGIPDYRSKDVGLYARSNHKPIQHIEFIKSSKVRQRFWARNYIGWPKFNSRLPNSVHKAVCDLEIKYNKVSCVVTQNVDSLHLKAGSQNIIELHGTGRNVICLNCKEMYDRHYIQDILDRDNPNFTVETSNMIRPDGDVEIPENLVNNFNVPLCNKCGSFLKPDITFFGDNVPKERVNNVKKAVSESHSILILGSSLYVFSGYRIILQAYEEGKNIAIVNIGSTRGDHLADLKINAKCGDILPKIVC